MAKDEVINFDTMKDMVLNTTAAGGKATMESKKRFQFKWDTNTKDIVTKYVSRRFISTVKEKRTIDGFDTKPSGYQE